MSNKVNVENIDCSAGGPHRLHARQTQGYSTKVRYMFENWCWKCGIRETEIQRQYAEDPTTPATKEREVSDGVQG